MAGWSVVVYMLFPVPLVCLLLLCLPFPGQIGKTVRKTVQSLVDRILLTPAVAGFNLYQVSLMVASMVFLTTCYETARLENKLFEAKNVLMTLKEDQFRCQKWRAERNFWISLMSLVLWLVLYRVNVMTNEITMLDDALGKEKKKAK